MPDEPDGAGPELTAFTTATMGSRGGGITVTTTEFGLPVALTVAAEELRREPGDLAAEILRLCKQAANRAGVARRAELAAVGVSPAGLELLGLPSASDVEDEEIRYESEREYEPLSWLERE